MSGINIFDAYQRVFAMSWISNKIMFDDSSQTNLEQLLFARLSNYITVNGTPPLEKYAKMVTKPTSDMVTQIGNWELVWGPGVYTNKGGGVSLAKNAVFVARCKDLQVGTGTKDVFVAAVAATNAGDSFDWLVEDGDVNRAILWDEFDPANVGSQTKYIKPDTDSPAWISAGTAIGTSIVLQDLKNPAWTNNKQQTSLGEFLSSIDGSNSSIVFAGHSLAGALSPTIAFYLKSKDPGKSIASFGDNVYTYPTAGATPGNEAFSNLYKEEFAPQKWEDSDDEKWQHLNVRLWNHYDVVPHAWARESHTDYDGNQSPNITEIASLYGNSPSKGDADQIATYWKVFASQKTAETHSGTHYYTLPGVRLDGTIQNPVPESFKDYMNELLYQHTTAYTKGLILPKDPSPFIKESTKLE